MAENNTHKLVIQRKRVTINADASAQDFSFDTLVNMRKVLGFCFARPADPQTLTTAPLITLNCESEQVLIKTPSFLFEANEHHNLLQSGYNYEREIHEGAVLNFSGKIEKSEYFPADKTGEYSMDIYILGV